MKILITGSKGQLGSELVGYAKANGIDAIGIDIDDCDITNYDAVKTVFGDILPDCVIHCAAYTAVDKAESNRDLCLAINKTGTENIAKVCKDIGAKLVYISTDYVFPGVGTDLYKPDDETNPTNFYGESKLLGELAVKEYLSDYFIVRISWVFGLGGGNFVKTMLTLADSKPALNVVGDQVGSPTYCGDLAPLLFDMAKSDKYGIYHAANEGFCTWAEFADFAIKTAGKTCPVTPITTEEYPTPAPRPKNSRMSKQKLTDNGFTLLPTWQSAVERYIKELNNMKEQ
jgi:dTDP-4-dehydrorhamnose reductase